jgi:hypothetical protein
MAKLYYDTPQRVYKLFKNHPALSQLYDEFNISMEGIKAVAQFLNINHDKIMATNLKMVYNTETPATLEADQGELFTDIDSYDYLPEIGDKTAIYHIKYPAPGFYYEWTGTAYREVPKSKEMSGAAFVALVQAERRYKIWDDEKGIFVKTEDGEWIQVDNGEYTASVIRKSELPDNAEAGDIYKVLGEDLLDCIAVLYGIADRGFTPPWSNYVSSAPAHSPLLELLYMTIYLYKFGVTDNFYEKNLWEFLPEYDRTQLLSTGKTKLLIESIGRKMDQIEDQLLHLESVYDFDDTPEHLLDHLGQMLGYEREDFTLSDMSFRELLKNVIEIYKIKGTNYSFSFFFKFLGFNINLKEFYFNRDASNPENFPNMNGDKVEWYLTTTNPIYETRYGMPAEHLGNIRNITDFELERESLLRNSCENPTLYMLGKEPFNNVTGENERWHNNPWAYFKTDLIEYSLSPFFDKLNLTSQDNETIKKYIKFLSPTYIFTWINIDLAPWIDSYDFTEETTDKISFILEKAMGDWDEDGEFKGYEVLYDYLQVSKDGKLIPFTEADSIFTNLTSTKEDLVGITINRTGMHSRLLSSPNFITGSDHSGKKFLAIDRYYMRIRETDGIDYRTDVTLDNGPGPLTATVDPNPDGTIPLLLENDVAKAADGQYYIYLQSSWVESGDNRTHVTTGDTRREFNSFEELLTLNRIDTNNVYHVLDVDKKSVCFSYTPGYLIQVYKPTDTAKGIEWEERCIRRINNTNLTEMILNSCLGISNNGIFTATNLLLEPNNVYCISVGTNSTYWRYIGGSWSQTNYYIVEEYYDLYLILSPVPNAVYYVKENNKKYKYVTLGYKPKRHPGFKDNIFKIDDGTEDGKELDVKDTLTWNQLLSVPFPTLTDYYKILDAPGYAGAQCYYFVKNYQWVKAFEQDKRYSYWVDYSIDSYPASPSKMVPMTNTNFTTGTISFSWAPIEQQCGYWIQIARKDGFDDYLIYENIFYDGTRNIQNMFFENDSYIWRMRVKNGFNMNGLNQLSLIKMLNDYPEFSAHFNFTNMILTVNNRREYDYIIGIMASYGLKYDWEAWTSALPFNIHAVPFPHNGQVLNRIDYTQTTPIYHETMGYFTGFKFDLEWAPAINSEYYDLQITYDVELRNIHTLIRIVPNTFTVEMGPGTYYWRVRAKTINKVIGNWGQILTFTIPEVEEIIV